MSIPSKTYVKIESQTNGDFTPKNNIVEIKLPSNLGMIDGNNTYLDANVRPARRGNEEVLLPVAFGYEFGRHHNLGSLIRNIQLVSSKYGILENINDVNVYSHNLNVYSMKAGANAIFNQSCNFHNQNTKVQDQFIKCKKLSENTFSGSADTDAERESSCKLALNRILGLFQTDFMNVSHLGDLTIRIEFSKTKLDGVIVGCEGDSFTNTSYEVSGVNFTSTAGQKTLTIATGKKVPDPGSDIFVSYNNNTDSEDITFKGRVESVAGQVITLEEAIKDSAGADIANGKDIQSITVFCLHPYYAREVNVDNSTLQQSTTNNLRQSLTFKVDNPSDFPFNIGQRVQVVLQQNATEADAKTSAPTKTNTFVGHIDTSFDSATTQLNMTVYFTDNVSALNNYIANAIITSSLADKSTNGGGAGTPTSPDKTNPLLDSEVSYNIQEVSVMTMVYDKQNPGMGAAMGKKPDTYNTLYSEKQFITQMTANGEKSVIFNAPPSITSSLLMYVPENSLTTNSDNLDEYRVQVNNELLEDRDTELNKSLYRDAIIDGIVSSDNPVYNVNIRRSSENEAAFVVASPLKFSNEYTKIDVLLEQNSNAGTSNKQLYNFYNQIKMYPK